MAIDGLDDAAIRAVLTTTRRVALVGASANPLRPAFGIQGFLQRFGFAVTPVNPGLAGQVLQGRTVVATLEEAAPLDMVDVFRASDHVPPVVDEAIRLAARVVWMQLGVVHEQAAARARTAGLVVVMDRCPAIEARRLGIARVA
ncbi:MAG: CoA-binding protein [Rhodospirillales bacterium]|nr:CoA-binding protein [Rhodospirillales bacterium]MDE2198393.1 CoA-binding protein [Rhodospirillales bacterium]MDE2576184.1 CoA-binding protein [Rhodospirillales bacterium]